MGEYIWIRTEADQIIDLMYDLDILTNAELEFENSIEGMINGYGTLFGEYHRIHAGFAYQRRQEEESREHTLSVL